MSSGCVIPHTPIAVDFWTLRDCSHCRVFFLTHLHADHITGLTSSWKYPIYCSEITKKLLVHKHGINENLVHVLQVGEAEIIFLDDLKKEQMVVTALDANHCPGSLMFLMQGYFGTILHTGDFRFQSEMLTETCLSQFTDKIDLMYLDNTYCDPACVFPSRDEAKEMIMDTIQQHPDHDILLAMRSLGKETLLYEIAMKFNEWIYVSPRHYQRLELLEAPSVFKSDSSEYRIKVIQFHQVSRKFVERQNERKPTLVIVPTALYEGIDCEPYVNTDKVVIVPYSDHSSFSELKTFVSHLKPKQIIPIVTKQKGPFGVSLSKRANMSVFSEFTDKSWNRKIQVPPSVQAAMENRLPVLSVQQKGIKRKRLRVNQQLAKKQKGVQYESPVVDVKKLTDNTSLMNNARRSLFESIGESESDSNNKSNTAQFGGSDDIQGSKADTDSTVQEKIQDRNSSEMTSETNGTPDHENILVSDEEVLADVKRKPKTNTEQNLAETDSHVKLTTQTKLSETHEVVNEIGDENDTEQGEKCFENEYIRFLANEFPKSNDFCNGYHSKTGKVLEETDEMLRKGQELKEKQVITEMGDIDSLTNETEQTRQNEDCKSDEQNPEDVKLDEKTAKVCKVLDSWIAEVQKSLMSTAVKEPSITDIRRNNGREGASDSESEPDDNDSETNGNKSDKRDEMEKDNSDDRSEKHSSVDGKPNDNVESTTNVVALGIENVTDDSGVERNDDNDDQGIEDVDSDLYNESCYSVIDVDNIEESFSIESVEFDQGNDTKKGDNDTNNDNKDDVDIVQETTDDSYDGSHPLLKYLSQTIESEKIGSAEQKSGKVEKKSVNLDMTVGESLGFTVTEIDEDDNSPQSPIIANPPSPVIISSSTDECVVSSSQDDSESLLKTDDGKTDNSKNTNHTTKPNEQEMVMIDKKGYDKANDKSLVDHSDEFPDSQTSTISTYKTAGEYPCEVDRDKEDKVDTCVTDEEEESRFTKILKPKPSKSSPVKSSPVKRNPFKKPSKSSPVKSSPVKRSPFKLRISFTETDSSEREMSNAGFQASKSEPSNKPYAVVDKSLIDFISRDVIMKAKELMKTNSSFQKKGKSTSQDNNRAENDKILNQDDNVNARKRDEDIAEDVVSARKDNDNVSKEKSKVSSRKGISKSRKTCNREDNVNERGDNDQVDNDCEEKSKVSSSKGSLKSRKVSIREDNFIEREDDGKEDNDSNEKHESKIISRKGSIKSRKAGSREDNVFEWDDNDAKDNEESEIRSNKGSLRYRKATVGEDRVIETDDNDKGNNDKENNANENKRMERALMDKDKKRKITGPEDNTSDKVRKDSEQSEVMDNVKEINDKENNANENKRKERALKDKDGKKKRKITALEDNTSAKPRKDSNQSDNTDIDSSQQSITQDPIHKTRGDPEDVYEECVQYTPCVRCAMEAFKKALAGHHVRSTPTKNVIKWSKIRIRGTFRSSETGYTQ